MSGRERLDARIGSRRSSVAQRVLVVGALLTFIALGVALELGWTPLAAAIAPARGQPARTKQARTPGAFAAELGTARASR